MFLAFLTLILVSSSDPVAVLAEADSAFFRIDYARALAAYEKVAQGTPAEPRLLWKLARIHVCMGEVDEDREQRDAHMRAAESYARQCIALDSLQAEGYTWLAGALGYLALDAGMGDQVRYAREIMDATGRAIALNPEDDAAYSIRGSLYRALGNTGWLKRQLAAILLGRVPEGGFEEGEKALLTAIALAPDIMRHHYELGILYIDWGRMADARRVLEQAATLEVRTAIDRPRKAKILKLLATMDE